MTPANPFQAFFTDRDKNKDRKDDKWKDSLSRRQFERLRQS
jgi:hypothetical protein